MLNSNDCETGLAEKVSDLYIIVRRGRRELLNTNIVCQLYLLICDIHF